MAGIGDDIIRQIDEQDAPACATEITRIKRKRRGYITAFNRSVKAFTSLIDSTRGEGGIFDRSPGKQGAIARERERLEIRYEKLQTAQDRILQLNHVQDDDVGYENDIDETLQTYQGVLQTLGELMRDMLPAAEGQQGNNNVAPQGTIRPMTALKPSFELSFDNTPTELACWIAQFRAYYEASRLHQLNVQQQQAFLRQGIHPDVWTAIKQRITIATQIFHNPADLEEESCESFIEDAFQIRYPLIMRRYKFFTYKRKGNQTFTNFFAKLKELATAAQLENMEQNDYIIFRVLVGIDDPTTVDKLLAIPTADFNLEEIHRVATACEAAKNYSGINSKTGHNISQKVSNQRKSNNSNQQSSGINAKLKALKQQGKCVRCGKQAHPKGEKCPHQTTKCHNCGIIGHISPVCARPKSGQKPGNGPHFSRNSSPSRNQARQASVTNYTFATYGPRPTPKQNMSFQDFNSIFSHDIIPDSGSSRTIFAKNLLDTNGITYEPNHDNEQLFNASSNPMTVNGTVQLTANFQGKSKLIEGLVSQDLKDDILLSWYDAEDLGSISITRYTSLEDPSSRIKAIKEKYCNILRDSLPEKPMDGPPMRIHFKKQAIANGIFPKKIYTATQVPLHMKDAAERALDIAIKNKLIEKVPVNEPSEWCSRGFFVPKPDGEARLVVDLSPLNEIIERPIHPFVAGTDLIKNLDSKSRVFCKLDAVLGYYQIPLDDDSKKLTTFLLASGRYRYLRAPMGCSASSDEWCKRSDEALSGIPGVHKLVDDILIEGTDYDELFTRIEEVLQRCMKTNITISLKKMQVGESVIFAGYQVSGNGIHPVGDRTKAIKEFPAPKNTKEMKSFLGLATQLAHFVPDLAHATGPLRELLKKNVAWQWLPDQENAFQRTKQILTGQLVLRPFNPNFVTELITDASRQGLGFVLMQQDPSTGNRHLIQCGSRSLNNPETRYAICELEALAIYYGVNKCKHYLLGMENFTVVTDHKPLKGVWKKHLPDIDNIRLRRYRERLNGYTFQIEWREGKTNEIADALSRAPVFPSNEHESPDFVDVCYALTNLQKEPFDPILAPMLNAAKVDADYQLIIKALSDGKNPKLLPSTHPARQLSSVWSELSIDQTGLIIVNGKRIYVPTAQRKTILNALHAAHCGTHKTTWRANDLYFWRGMSSEIKIMIQDCDTCKPFLPSQAQEPIIAGTSATGPMTDVGSDLFQIGKNHYIVMVDRYSGFPFVEKLSKLSTQAITKILTTWFNTFGWPERIRTDNGPQFRSEFGEFCKEHNILHENSSPYYPQSNGLSEAAVKQMKYLLEKINEDQSEFSSRLLEFRNTPNVSGKSPAQMFFGRRLRGRLPHLPGANDLDIANAKAGADNRKHLMEKLETKHGTPLKQLEIGQRVLIQNPQTKSWDEECQITGIRPTGRSYDVLFDNGKSSIRNRTLLRPINKATKDTKPDIPTTEVDKPPDDEPAKLTPRRSARLSNKRNHVTFDNN